MGSSLGFHDIGKAYVQCSVTSNNGQERLFVMVPQALYMCAEHVMHYS